MGADIHMVLEKRVLPPGLMPGNEVWLGVNAFPYVNAEVFVRGKSNDDHGGIHEGSVHWLPTNRNYDLFGALAGVRRAGPTSPLPRGLPDDVSMLAAMMSARWGEDGHSHSWMLMDEALPLFIANHQFGHPEKAVLDAMSKGTGHALESHMRYFWGMEDDDRLEDFRLVFWFDN